MKNSNMKSVLAKAEANSKLLNASIKSFKERQNIIREIEKVALLVAEASALEAGALRDADELLGKIEEDKKTLNIMWVYPEGAAEYIKERLTDSRRIRKDKLKEASKWGMEFQKHYDRLIRLKCSI